MEHYDKIGDITYLPVGRQVSPNLPSPNFGVGLNLAEFKIKIGC